MWLVLGWLVIDMGTSAIAHIRIQTLLAEEMYLYQAFDKVT